MLFASIEIRVSVYLLVFGCVIKVMFWILNHITEPCESYLKHKVNICDVRMTVLKVHTHFSQSRLQKFTQIFAEAFGAELTCELQWRKGKAGNRLGRKGVGKWRKGGLGKLTVPFTCQSHKHTLLRVSFNCAPPNSHAMSHQPSNGWASRLNWPHSFD